MSGSSWRGAPRWNSCPAQWSTAGSGFLTFLGSVTALENVSDLITLTTEPGAIGGEPASGLNFGSAYNADAFVEHHAQFDWYDGGGLDVAFLGLGQADRHGNVNVSLFDGRAVGIGGFVNISQETKTIVYCGAFAAGGLKIASGDGQLRIVTEGKHRKFIDTVEQISFSGSYATKFGRRVVYVTERAVFELREEQMTPVEIAPGVDLDRDVLPQMDFVPAIVDPLPAMPGGIFHELWGKLGSRMTATPPVVKTPTTGLRTASGDFGGRVATDASPLALQVASRLRYRTRRSLMKACPQAPSALPRV